MGGRRRAPRPRAPARGARLLAFPVAPRLERGGVEGRARVAAPTRTEGGAGGASPPEVRRAGPSPGGADGPGAPRVPASAFSPRAGVGPARPLASAMPSGARDTSPRHPGPARRADGGPGAASTRVLPHADCARGAAPRRLAAAEFGGILVGGSPFLKTGAAFSCSHRLPINSVPKALVGGCCRLGNCLPVIGTSSLWRSASVPLPNLSAAMVIRKSLFLNSSELFHALFLLSET